MGMAAPERRVTTTAVMFSLEMSRERNLGVDKIGAGAFTALFNRHALRCEFLSQATRGACTGDVVQAFENIPALSITSFRAMYSFSASPDSPWRRYA